MSAAIWNRVAEEQQLQTRMAAALFPLSDIELEEELERRSNNLASQGYSSAVIVSYFILAPLLWENAALQAFVHDHPGFRGALPDVLSIDEAVMIAERDRVLEVAEKDQLRKLLAQLPA